jgi:hypothetical protein
MQAKSFMRRVDSGQNCIACQPMARVMPLDWSRDDRFLLFGSQPRWRRDGKELFYFAPDSFRLGIPKPLFRATVLGGRGGGARSAWRWDVSPDGQRFFDQRRARGGFRNADYDSSELPEYIEEIIVQGGPASRSRFL